MICDRLWIRNIIQTCLFLGLLSGCLFGGIIADKLGRRFGCRFSLLWTVVFWLLTALTPLMDLYLRMDLVIILYCFFKFCVGFGQFSLVSVILLQISEMTGTNDRAKVNISVPMWWAVGEIIFVGIAYIIRDPIKLNCSLVALFIPFLMMQIFIPESVRWLLVEKRFQEAYQLVERKVRWNKGNTSHLTNWTDLVNCEKAKLQNGHFDGKGNTSLILNSLRELLRSKVMLIILFCCCNLIFSSVIIYYGYSLSTNKLTGNPFRNFLLSAILELLGIVFTNAATRLFSKKSIIITLFVASGTIYLTLVVQALIEFEEWKTVVDMVVLVISFIGKMVISGICAIVVFLCLELFPTSVRGICFGICNFASRIGAFLAPQILFLSDKYHPVICYSIFGIFAIIAAITTLYIPRTSHLPMTQTVGECEELYKMQSKYK
ncbi:hypothetical protein SNEBB_010619 [Seison nebaliae]|nr:hypothetical protein SNEBB_010619 [Seison nebaliae]